MTDDRRKRDYLARAVSPTLFSAAMYPDLITALMIANLLSPGLWDLAERVRPTKTPSSPLRPLMKKLHGFINRHFFHPDSIRFLKTWGFYERELVTDPEEQVSSDRALAIMREGLRFTRYRDDEFLSSLFRNGAAPRYVYPNVDMILAYGPMFREMKQDILGMTCCLDECVLIASLALALGVCRLEDIVLVGSPFHYILLLFPDADGYLFNAKREFFDKPKWMKSSKGGPESGGSLFMEKIFVCDRIVTPAGYCVFPDGPTTLSPETMAETLEKLSGFLGERLPFFNDAMEQCRNMSSAQDQGHELLDTIAPLSRDSIETCLLEGARNSSVLQAALYAFRHPDVRDPEIYTRAARQGFKSYIMSGLVAAPDDATEIVEGIKGSESIYGRNSRLAIPDEVLAFDTADDRERELLYDTLLYHAGI